MVECTGLENQHTETYRGFESHPLRFSSPLAGVNLPRVGFERSLSRFAGSTSSLRDFLYVIATGSLGGIGGQPLGFSNITHRETRAVRFMPTPLTTRLARR